MLEVHAILQRQRCNENITKKTGTLSDAYGDEEPYRDEGCWDYDPHNDVCIELPKGTIKKILGRELTWEDEPVELR